jgi:branched-chain amino acid transport system substrate-binding protein
VLLDAIGRAGDKATNGDDLAKAIRATKIDAPWGELRFDPKTGYAIAPTYYYTAVLNDGVLSHKIVAEMP